MTEVGWHDVDGSTAALLEQCGYVVLPRDTAPITVEQAPDGRWQIGLDADAPGISIGGSHVVTRVATVPRLMEFLCEELPQQADEAIRTALPAPTLDTFEGAMVGIAIVR